jgi:hypothetical protein
MSILEHKRSTGSPVQVQRPGRAGRSGQSQLRARATWSASTALDQLRDLAVLAKLCTTMHGMATRLSEPTERQTPLPLTPRDQAGLAKLREAGPERYALSSLVAALPEGDVSEALLVHAVFPAGLRAVREVAESAAYESDAARRHARMDAERATAQRTQPSWAGDD